MPQHPTFTEQQEMQQIIGAIPDRIWHRGILGLLFLVIGITAAAWWVRYPDVIEIPVVISTEKPLIEVKATLETQLETLLVSDGQQVESGQVLAVFKSGVEYEDILQLEQFLKQLDQKANVAEVAGLSLLNGLNIGYLQAELGALEMSIRKLKDIYRSGYTVQRITTLKAEQNLTISLNESLRKQMEKLEEEVRIAEGNFKDYQQLFKEGAEAKRKMETVKTFWLNQARQLEAKRAEIIQNNLTAKRIDGQILLLQQTDEEAWQESFRQLKRQTAALITQIELWKQKYLLTAPVSGSLVFTDRLSPGQYITNGSAVFSIASKDPKGKLFAIGKLSGSGGGKAETGMNVFIRLTSFPYKEFGELQGQIQHIATAPAVENGHSFYPIHIRLPNQLKTNFDRKISFRQEMPGLARIITEDRSLLQRLFEYFYF